MNASPKIQTDACSTPAAALAFDDAMKLVGDFWTLRIIDAIRESELRFCEIERALSDSNPATLTGRLKRLEEAGVVQRNCETRDRQSVTYELTEKGYDLIPVLDAIKAFTSNK